MVGVKVGRAHGVHALEKEKPHFGHSLFLPLAVHLPDTFSENIKGFYSGVLQTGGLTEVNKSLLAG